MASKNQDLAINIQEAAGSEHRADALPLLKTKLYRPPVTPDLEQRTRLIEYLERTRQRPLTLISAPAGYGKTILASQWLESSNCRSGWVSLDEFDNDLLTFVSYMLAAVRNTLPSIKLDTQSLLKASIVPIASVLARYLLNDLDQLDEPFILTLDDIHRIHEPQIYVFLNELINHPTHAMHLVLLGRHDPPLHIASLRARGQVSEIRAQDLRFTAQETAGLLSSMLDRPIDEAVAADWARMTEGWVTAIRLAALSLRHRGQSDDLRVNIQGETLYLKEYLLAEVLSHMPVANQAWLLKTAFLERFCAPLCEAVCQTEGDPAHLSGDSFIDGLERENLFLVPLDDRGEWFRFHHLFQGMLQNLLQTQASPDEIAALRSRASGWHADHGSLEEALQYSLVAGDVQAAVHLVLRYRYDLINTEHWARLDRWMKLLPADVVAENPLLLSTMAYLATNRGQTPEMISSVQHAENLLADLIPGTAVYQIVRGEIDAIIAVLDNVGGQPARSMERAQNSLKYLPANAWSFRSLALAAIAVGLQMQGDLQGGANVIREALAEQGWPVVLQAKMLIYLCIAFFQEGDLANVLASARTGMWIIDKSPLPETLGLLRYWLGIAHYLRNELSQAETILQAMQEDRATTPASYLAQGSFALAMIHRAQNHPADAVQVMNLLISQFQRTGDTQHLMFAEAFRVELALYEGELVEARRLSKGVDFEPQPPIWFSYVPQLTKIKLLLAEGKSSSMEDAYTRLDVLAETMRGVNRKNVLKGVLALQALVCAAQGDEPNALDKLCAALDLGNVGGDIRTFTDLGAPMANLLYRLNGHGAGKEYAEYIEHILAAFPGEVRATQVFEQAPTLTVARLPKVPPIKPLTMRELQVLKLLATDLSTKEIADQLVISPGTLHTHTKNIYRKFNVHKRVEVVQLAKYLDMEQ